MTPPACPGTARAPPEPRLSPGVDLSCRCQGVADPRDCAGDGRHGRIEARAPSKLWRGSCGAACNGIVAGAAPSRASRASHGSSVWWPMPRRRARRGSHGSGAPRRSARAAPGVCGRTGRVGRVCRVFARIARTIRAVCRGPYRPSPGSGCARIEWASDHCMWGDEFWRVLPPVFASNQTESFRPADLGCALFFAAAGRRDRLSRRLPAAKHRPAPQERLPKPFIDLEDGTRSRRLSPQSHTADAWRLRAPPDRARHPANRTKFRGPVHPLYSPVVSAASRHQRASTRTRTCGDGGDREG